MRRASSFCRISCGAALAPKPAQRLAVAPGPGAGCGAWQAGQAGCCPRCCQRPELRFGAPESLRALAAWHVRAVAGRHTGASGPPERPGLLPSRPANAQFLTGEGMGGQWQAGTLVARCAGRRGRPAAEQVRKSANRESMLSSVVGCQDSSGMARALTKAPAAPKAVPVASCTCTQRPLQLRWGGSMHRAGCDACCRATASMPSCLHQ